MMRRATSGRPWATGALTELEQGVLVRQKEASSWERYRQEVLSGSLARPYTTWSPLFCLSSS